MVKKIISIFMVFALLFLGACSVNQNTHSNNSDLNNDDDNNYNNEKNTTLDLKKINSIKELKELILKAQITQQRNVGSGGILEKSLSRDGDSVASEATLKSDSTTNNYATDYSTTNIQVEGVDEADIVKNDGKYIYTISQKKVLILDAYPAKNASVLSEIKFDQDINIQELFIYKNKLVVIGQASSELFKVSPESLIPYPYYEPQTVVQIFSIIDKENPTLEKEYKVTGSYYDARVVGDYVYFLSQKNMNSNEGITTPVLYKDGLRIAQGDIYYFDIKPSSVYYTITSVSLQNPDSYTTENYLLEYGSTLYVSKNNIYIAYPKRITEDVFERFKEVILPGIDKEKRAIFSKHLTRKDKEALALTLEQYYNSLDEKEQKKFTNIIEENTRDYNDKRNAELRKTVIQKFSIKEGKIYYLAKGEVDGNLLNQFSMDEKDGYLRVATTKSYWIRGEGSHSYSNVYVLDKDLEYVGWIERLAEGERIYSTRFLGDKLYMVTFKQTDPLFVIDLSTPEQPKVLGKLKISGYSSYLHPYGDNYLIGIGKETKELDNGRVITDGVKVSLFDVSDFKNPKEIDKYVIGGRWSDTPVLYDHKAFLFSESKRMLIVPVREDLSEKDDYSERNYFQGAYVFEITVDGKIKFKGKITHKEKEEGNYYWYSSPYSVQRSLYMDDVLYTISQGKVVANDIKTLDKIKEIDLGYEMPKKNPYPVYYSKSDTAVAEKAIIE